MLDGLELAQAIAKGRSIAACERKLCARAGADAAESLVLAETLVAKDPSAFVDLFKGMMPSPWVLFGLVMLMRAGKLARRIVDVVVSLTGWNLVRPWLARRKPTDAERLGDNVRSL
jgi:hypothetical protein